MVDVQHAALFGQFLGHRERYRGIGVVGAEKGKKYDGAGGIVVFHPVKIRGVRENFGRNGIERAPFENDSNIWCCSHATAYVQFSYFCY